MFNKKYFSLSKIYQEFYFICRVLDSCETPEQFENTCNWIGQILIKWEEIFIPVPQKEYDLKYNDIITYLVTVIDDSIENKRTELFPEQSQNIVVKGFR